MAKHAGTSCLPTAVLGSNDLVTGVSVITSGYSSIVVETVREVRVDAGLGACTGKHRFGGWIDMIYDLEKRNEFRSAVHDLAK